MKKFISETQETQGGQKLMGTAVSRPPQANSVKSFLDANKRDDNFTAPQPKPYPLPMADEVLSDMYIATLNLKKILDQVGVNPALKDKYKQNIEYVRKRVELLNRTIVDISGELDKIV